MSHSGPRAALSLITTMLASSDELPPDPKTLVEACLKCAQNKIANQFTPLYPKLLKFLTSEFSILSICWENPNTGTLLALAKFSGIEPRLFAAVWQEIKKYIDPQNVDSYYGVFWFLSQNPAKNFDSILMVVQHFAAKLNLLDFLHPRYIKDGTIFNLLESQREIVLIQKILQQIKGQIIIGTLLSNDMMTARPVWRSLLPLLAVRNLFFEACQNPRSTLTILKELANQAYAAGYMNAFVTLGDLLECCFPLEALAAYQRVPTEAWGYEHAQKQIKELKRRVHEHEPENFELVSILKNAHRSPKVTNGSPQLIFSAVAKGYLPSPAPWPPISLPGYAVEGSIKKGVT